LRDGSFKYRAQGSLGWKLDNFRIRSTTTYYGQISDSNVLRDKYRALLATNPDAEVPTFLNTGDVWAHDLSLSFDLEIGRAHVSTPVTTAHLVCHLLIAK